MQQGKFPEKDAVQISCSVRTCSVTLIRTNSSLQALVALAGIAFGGFFFAPITYYVRRCTIIFWALIGCLAFQIWTACLTPASQNSKYIISRIFAGIFGGVPSVMGPRLLVDIYPPSQQGRVFNIFHSALLLGMVAGPTFSACVFAGVAQSVDYWWTVAILAATIIFVFLILENTDPKQGHDLLVVRLPDSFMRNRMATFFFGTKVVPPLTGMQLVSYQIHISKPGDSLMSNGSPSYGSQVYPSRSVSLQ